MKHPKNRFLSVLSSLEVTIAALSLLMLLVLFCTLAQVELGTWGAVDKYFRSLFLYFRVPGTRLSLPWFPAGGAVGLLLLANLAASLTTRFQWSWRKSGLVLVHAGFVLMVLGEFVTGMMAVETHLSFEEGQGSNYSESSRKNELAVFDKSAADLDTVYAIAERSLREGKILRHDHWPFDLKIVAWHRNAAIGPRPSAGNLPPGMADRGIGAEMLLRPLAPESRDDRRNLPAAFVEVRASGQLLGTWLVSSALEGPQEFEAAGRRFALVLRPQRRYMPFTLTLKDFSHDRYPGTDIPKNFSSLVQLANPATGEEREVLIYMNHPLRYMGRTFFQSSFGKNDTLSVLQVVENPGWLIPYVSFGLMAAGLGLHFALMLARFKPAEAAGRTA